MFGKVFWCSYWCHFANTTYTFILHVCSLRGTFTVLSLSVTVTKKFYTHLMLISWCSVSNSGNLFHISAFLLTISSLGQWNFCSEVFAVQMNWYQYKTFLLSVFSGNSCQLSVFTLLHFSFSISVFQLSASLANLMHFSLQFCLQVFQHCSQCIWAFRFFR